MLFRSPDDEIRHALNRLVCAYVDLKRPVPDDLVFMEPDDQRASAQRTAKGSPATGSRRFVIPTCFSPLYSADTPTTTDAFPSAVDTSATFAPLSVRICV